MAHTPRACSQAPRRLILDSGAVIALARGGQRARAFLARSLEMGAMVEIPVVVLAETVRGGPRDAPVNRVLKAVGPVPEAREAHGRIAGQLLGATRSSSTIDALVVAHAVEVREPGPLARMEGRCLGLRPTGRSPSAQGIALGP